MMSFVKGVTRGLGPPLQMMSFEVTSVIGPSYYKPIGTSVAIGIRAGNSDLQLDSACQRGILDPRH